jgi:hypothetical protein
MSLYRLIFEKSQHLGYWNLLVIWSMTFTLPQHPPSNISFCQLSASENTDNLKIVLELLAFALFSNSRERKEHPLWRRDFN